MDIPQSSPAINTGVAQNNISTWQDPFWNGIFPPDGTISVHGATDYRGNPRFSEAIDLGAFEFENTLTVANIETKPVLAMYPNPVRDVIHFSITGKKYRYSIYTIGGEQIKKGAAFDRIKINALPAGMYVLKVEGDTQQWAYKFVKAK